MKILVIAKQTKLEWDAMNRRKTEREVIEEYKREGANWEAIVASHKHQNEMRANFSDVIQPLELLDVGDFARHHKYFLKEKWDLVISLGGDNSFTRVSHFLTDTPLLGVTVDPARSHGALNSEKVSSLEDIQRIAQCLKGGFSVEEWTRIECELNGKKQLPLATSEIFLGERLRKNMSRHIVEDRYNNVEQKCSGLIVATGAGSTGWMKSAKWQARPYLFMPPSRVDRFLNWYTTELFNRKSESEGYGWISATPASGSHELKLTSLNDDGIISIDSWEEKKFNRGAVAKIRIGKPLKVAKLK